jgi:anthranilate phosphoribosyltransferase
MKFAAPVRKELGFRTVFNLIGPLSNPLSPSYQLVGVYNKNLLEVYANVLKNLNCKKAIICHSNDGFDEFSIFQTTHFVLLENGNISKHEFNPDILKLENLNPSEVFAINKIESVHLSEKILQGENSTGALKVALNVGVGLFLMGKENSIESGFFTARTHLLSGKVHSYFKMLIADSRT